MPEDLPLSEQSITTTITVAGMTCDHCVRAVSGEISKLDGVGAVAVDLPTGTVTIESDHPLDAADVSAAIDEAGYEVVG